MSRKHVADFKALKHMRELRRDGLFKPLPKGVVMSLDTYTPPQGRPRSIPPLSFPDRPLVPPGMTLPPCTDAACAHPTEHAVVQVETTEPTSRGVDKPYHSPAWYANRQSPTVRQNISRGQLRVSEAEERAARRMAAAMNAESPSDTGMWMTVRQYARRAGIGFQAARGRATRGNWPKRYTDDRKPVIFVPRDALPAQQAQPGAVTPPALPSLLRRAWNAIVQWVHP